MLYQQQQHSSLCRAASAQAQLLTDNVRLQQSVTGRMNPSSKMLKMVWNWHSKSTRHQQHAMVLLSALHQQHPKQQQAGSARPLSAVQQQTTQQLRHSSSSSSSRPMELALLGLAVTTLNWQ
jgi:hypothetical protein